MNRTFFYKPSQQLRGKIWKIISKEQRNYFKKQVGLLISKIFISKNFVPNLYGNFTQLSTIQSKQKSMNFRNSFQSLREKQTKKFEVKVFHNSLTNFLYHSNEFCMSWHLLDDSPKKISNRTRIEEEDDKGVEKQQVQVLLTKNSFSVLVTVIPSSDPTHSHSWLNWLPNDEEIENFQTHTNRSINNQQNTIMTRWRTDESWWQKDY